MERNKKTWIVFFFIETSFSSNSRKHVEKTKNGEEDENVIDDLEKQSEED